MPAASRCGDRTALPAPRNSRRTAFGTLSAARRLQRAEIDELVASYLAGDTINDSRTSDERVVFPHGLWGKCGPGPSARPRVSAVRVVVGWSAVRVARRVQRTIPAPLLGSVRDEDHRWHKKDGDDAES